MRIIKDEDNQNNEKGTKKQKYIKYNVPGPGSYNIQDNNKGLKYSMGQRHEKKLKSSKSPPVGSYNLRKEKDFIVPSHSFGKEKRDNLNINKTALENPGPGEYSYQSEKTCSSSPKWRFGPDEINNKKNKKNKEEKNNYHVPGPGYYKINSYIGKEGQKYSFGKEKFSHSDAFEEYIKQKSINYPNSTTYNKLYYKYISNSPKWSFSLLSRKNLINDKFKCASLGPEYNPDYTKNSIYKKYPLWSFNNPKRDEDDITMLKME